jgi:hypothetical protein
VSKLEDVIDKALIERIVHWFGEPTPGAPPPPREPEPAYTKDVDPAMVEWLARRRSRQLVRPRAPVRLAVTAADVRQYRAELPAAIASASSRLGRSRSLSAAMAEKTPQAVLRDLHRPERDFSQPVSKPEALLPDPLGVSRRAKLRAVMASRLFVNIAAIPLGWKLYRDARAALEQTLAQPWENSLPAELARDRGAPAWVRY